jgi:hypothetical protein
VAVGKAVVSLRRHCSTAALRVDRELRPSAQRSCRLQGIARHAVRRALQQGCVRLAIGRPVHGQRLRSLDDTAADEVAQGISNEAASKAGMSLRRRGIAGNTRRGSAAYVSIRAGLAAAISQKDRSPQRMLSNCARGRFPAGIAARLRPT